MITINALACKVRKKNNPGLEVVEILFSLADEKTRLARNIRQELNDTYKMIFKTNKNRYNKIKNNNK